MAKRKRFGEILVEARVVDEAQLARALEKQKGSGRRLGQILDAMGIVTERDIAAALARQFGFKTVSNIARASFSQELLDLFDGDTAMKKLLFPLKKEGNTLFLAMVNPLDIETLDNISFKRGLRVIPCVTTPTEIQSAVNRHYYNLLENVELAAYDPSVVVEVPRERNHAQDDRWTILIVDDQDHVRSSVVAALRREGYDLLEAGNGQDALKIAQRERLHLIFADTGEMPEMDGYEMFRAIQANQGLRNLPVVGLSSDPSVEEEAKLLEMGYYDCIVKPVNPVRLVARTRHALRILYGNGSSAR